MSTVKVNTVDKRTGSTLTLGGCGTTVTLGAGATQSGFGRTGTVDWCTTAKTAPFTGVSGNGYFVNTTCGAVTVTLPATPSAGDIISIADYASTFQTNNLTLCRNGSLINGGAFNAALSTQGQSITLVYVDGTKGWKNTMDSTSNVSGAPNFILATGGTITCCGDYKIHTFTSDGTFTVNSAPTPANNNISYLVVAGGASGATGCVSGGGGGAGGYREGKVSTDPYTASPLDSTAGLPVSVQSYPVTVGGGGGALTPVPSTLFAGNDGSPSVFSSITSTGGGGGGAATNPPAQPEKARPGGSGGGGYGNSAPGTGGSGNTPPTSPPQGNNGGSAQNPPSYANTGGGGGATQAGESKTSPYGPTGGAGGFGGAGATTSISASPTAYAGGGGGSADTRGGNPGAPSGAGGTGGGGAGANFTCAAGSGTTNTGGGGGGGNGPANGGNDTPTGAGGSGIVIIRYKYQ
jgi:hypothetical protein